MKSIGSILLTILLILTGCTSHRTVSITQEHRLSFATDSTLCITSRTDTVLTQELRIDLPLWQFFPVPR